MNIIWRLHRSLGKLIPKSAIKKIRYFLESKYDFLWEKKYFGQFGEDAVLQEIFAARAWQETQKGFYIDVGAYAPKQYSNTYYFYTQGWRGINIDASPGSMRIFDKVRKGDINIEAAVSDQEKDVILYSWGTPTVCNTLSKEHAARFSKIFEKEPEEIKVRTKTLAKILDANVPTSERIDFLTVDVENHNLEVLASNNWEKYKPIIVVVEVDEDDIDKILKSRIVAFMKAHDYKLCAWVGPSIFFKQEKA